MKLQPQSAQKAQDGFTSARILLCSLCLFVAIFSALAAGYPQWWTDRGVVTTGDGTVTNDFAPATAGQLKWIATNAMDELNEHLPGGAGTQVNAFVSGFTSSNNYVPVLIGHAKTVAVPFYNRLIAVGYATNYPWLASTNPPNDYAPANIGQVKKLFGFDLTYDGNGDGVPDWGQADADGDGLPDYWERKFGLNCLDASDANMCFNNAGVTAYQAYQNNQNPRNPEYSDYYADIYNDLEYWTYVSTATRPGCRGFVEPDKICGYLKMREEWKEHFYGDNPTGPAPPPSHYQETGWWETYWSHPDAGFSNIFGHVTRDGFYDEPSHYLSDDYYITQDIGNWINTRRENNYFTEYPYGDPWYSENHLTNCTAIDPAYYTPGWRYGPVTNMSQERLEMIYSNRSGWVAADNTPQQFYTVREGSIALSESYSWSQFQNAAFSKLNAGCSTAVHEFVTYDPDYGPDGPYARSMGTTNGGGIYLHRANYRVFADDESDLNFRSVWLDVFIPEDSCYHGITANSRVVRTRCFYGKGGGYLTPDTGEQPESGVHLDPLSNEDGIILSFPALLRLGNPPCYCWQTNGYVNVDSWLQGDEYHLVASNRWSLIWLEGATDASLDATGHLVFGSTGGRYSVTVDSPVAPLHTTAIVTVTRIEFTTTNEIQVAVTNMGAFHAGDYLYTNNFPAKPQWQVVSRYEGQDAAYIDSTGIVCFGRSGGKYTIVASGTNSGECAAYLDVNVPRIRAAMTPDFNRDGKIDGADTNLLAIRGLFRFWKNDDRDTSDDTSEAEDDSPEGSYAPDALRDGPKNRTINCNDTYVNGLRDLVDFFPVYLDMPTNAYPPGPFTYSLKQDDDAIRLVYTSLEASDVGRIHREKVGNCGVNANAELDYADTVALHWEPAKLGSGDPVPAGANEGTHPAPTLDANWLSRHNVILIEGVKDTTKPLVLEIRKDTNVVCRCEMGLSISSVSNMFRYLNVRTNDVIFRSPSNGIRPALVGKWGTNLGEPGNYPDGFYNADGETTQTLVSIHGFDWDETETPGGHAETFKRFFQSGCNARYIGVSWASDLGRRVLYHLITAPIVYNTDEIGAFVVAPYIKDALADFWGQDTSIFAHSLGNVVTCSMICDHGGLTIKNYFVVNPALAVEAIEGRQDYSSQTNMIPPDWKHYAGGNSDAYSTNLMAAYWPALFTNTDPRSVLTWADRFGRIADSGANVVDFFSPGEDVLRQPNGNIPPLYDFFDDNDIADHEYIWVANEMTKARPKLLAAPYVLHNHAGWSYSIYNGYYADGDDGLSHRFTPSQMAAVPFASLIQHPFFGYFESQDPDMPLWDDAGDWIYKTNGADIVRQRLPLLPFTTEADFATRINKIKNHAKILCEAIPAVSGPLGGYDGALNKVADKFNMNNLYGPGRSGALWPARRDKNVPKRGRWLHGDYKDAAYLYVHGLYDECTRLIERQNDQ
jgi:hypothetical protein